MKKIILICFIALLTFDVIAQTGPGGVGNNSGAGNLKFWLRGDSASIDTGVDTLFDLSGYNNHFVQPTTTLQPTILTLNGFDVVNFDGGGDYLMDIDGNSYINGASAFTFLFVIKSDITSTDKGWFVTENPTGADDSLSIRYDATGDNGGLVNVITASTGADGPIESSAGVQTTDEQLVTFTWLSNQTPELYLDGTQNTLSYGNLIVGLVSGADSIILGKGTQDTGVGDGWDGIIAEVIYFNKQLNSAERTIVENYLSTRYDLTISNDEYTPADEDYIYDVVGIGVESDGDHNGSVSAGFGINEDNSTLDTDGEYIFASHDNTTNDIASINTTDVVAPVEAAWNRSWYLEKNGANVDLKIYFDFGDGIEGGGIPQNISNYRLLYRAGTTGNYSVVTTTTQGIQSGDQMYFEVANANIVNGYYTLGTIDQTNSPVQGSSTQTWYTLVGGNWEDHQIWTLDPSGALPDNPNSEIPEAEDNVVVLSGKTATVNANNYTVSSINVEGRLYLGATTGHDFTEIGGNGRIYIEGDYFPAGDSTDFITSGLGEGTVVYSGDTTINLTIARTFYNMEIIMDNTTDTVYLMSDYILNGHLKIEKGILKINNDDPASTSLITLDIEGDVDVYADGSLTVGTADAYTDNSGGAYGDYHEGFHQIIVNGDFTNQGIVRLTNLAVPNYSVTNMATDLNGAVSLVFTGTSNNTFTCENTTDLYNLVIDKGTSQTYQLEIYAEDTSHFALFGDNNNTWNNGDAANPETQKALWIKAGTMRLTGEIYIPSLNEGGIDYTIGENARIFLDGPNVFLGITANESTIYTGLSHGDPTTFDDGCGSQGLYVLGKLQVDNGYFLLGEAEAINFLDDAAGIIQVNGGELNADQIAISSGASAGDYSYYQTGGIVRLTGDQCPDADNAILHLDNTNMVFTMSGGEIIIEGIAPTDPLTETNGILISSAEGNYNVTGGTVTVNYTGGTNVEVNSTANFYNFTIKQNTDILLENSIEITNDLTIENGADLNADGKNVSIGSDFYFNDGATYTHGINTTTFNDDEDSYIYVGDITTDSDITFNNLTIDKDIPASASENYDVIFSSAGRAATDTIARIEVDLTVNNGRLSTNTFMVSLRGDIVNKKGIIADGTNPGRIVLTGGSAQHSLTSSLVFNPSYGHIELNDANGAIVTTDILMDQFTLTAGLFDIGDYLLTIDTNFVGGGGFGTTKMIQASGNHSARGLKMRLDGNYTTATTIAYPIGTSGAYNYGDIDIPNTTGSITGYLTVIPVSQYHPALRGALGGCDAEEYYWKVNISSSLDGVTDIDYTFYHSFAPLGGSARAVYYDGSEWQNGSLVGVNDDATYTDIGFISTDCSIGKNACFNNVSTVYSDASGDWNNDATWDPGIPAYYDVVVILPTHTVTMDADNTEVASLTIYNGGILDLEDWTGNNFTRVDGGGKIRISDNAGSIEFPVGDFGDFCNNDTAVFEYYGGDYTIPGDLVIYPTMHISGDASSTKTLPDQDLLVRKDLLIYDNVNNGVELWLNSSATARELIVLDSVVFENQSKLVFPAAGTAKTLTIYENINMEPGGSSDINTIEIENAVGTTTHEIYLYNDIRLGASDLTFHRGAANSDINITFIGDSTSYIYNESTVNDTPKNIQFNKITINKNDGVDVYLDEEFEINGATDGATSTKALQITTGDCYITNALTNITVSSGGGDFKIPSGSILSIQGATINVSGNNTGIKLDGELELNNSASALINGGINNYIEYTASGYSTLTIDEATLRVGSQIRRQTYTTDGVLKFNQSHINSTIVIGETDAPEGTRGIFEILNIGSEFTQVADANITIVRQQTSPSIEALYLDPETPNIGLGASFTFGDDSNTPISQIIGLNSSVNLKNIIINSTNAPTVQLQDIALTIEEDLTIESGASFDANALALNIQGDFTNSGTFEPNGNTTTFNGSSDQKITGKTTFYNLTKSTSNALSLSETLTDTIFIENDFRIEDGTFRDSSNAVSVKGDMLHNGTHVYGGSGNGIEMLGIIEQVVTGDGSGIYGMLTISNASGVGVQVDIGNELFIEDGLNLNGGVLDVGNNLLDLSVDAQIIEGSAFSSSNMIRTNISFTDNGVRKTFPSGGPYNYIIPIGSGDKYTPVEYKITANGNSTGKIITKAADERHPSIVEDSEDPPIVDINNVLQYHWVVKSSGITGFSADVEMEYYDADIWVTSPYDVTDYITARLLNDGSGEWNKYDADDFDEANNLCLFNFDNVGDDEIEGDYTAGIDDAIPNQVPFYETNNSGSWTDGSIWTPNVSGGPRGAMVRINTGDTVYMPSNFKSSYTTTINGVLEVDSTFGHRAGEVDGTGTLYTKRASLPAGYYADFFAVTGGTLEYGGSANYDILAGFTQINNLKLSGTAERRFPNQDVTLLGDLTIDGDDATLNVINDHDQKITIDGDIYYNTGSFDAGDGANAIIEMNGTAAQTINGKFTGTNNDFNHFVINNSNGVTLTDSVDVYGNLTFTSGIITVPNGKALSMTYHSTTISGEGSSNYVDGSMRKLLQSGATFTFPVGNASRYGQVEIINTLTSGSQFWEAEYYNANPNDASMDTISREASLEMISGNEYWRIKSINTDSSHVKIRWDSNSMLPAMTDDRPNNLKIVEWSGAQWEDVGSDVTDNSVNDGTIQTDIRVGLEQNYYTIGTTESAPLPTAGFISSDTSICFGGTADLIVQLTGTAPWSIKVDSAGTNWTHTAIASSPYTINTSPVDNTTYTITEVTDDTPTTSTTTIFGSPVTVTVVPLPIAHNVTDGGAYCAGGSGVAVGLDGSETGVTYELYVDGAPAGSTVGGDGGAISFGNQTTAGNYTVEAAKDANTNCTQTMTGSVNVTIDPLPVATLTVTAAVDSICHGNNTELTVTVTTGASPFDFTVSDGTDSDSFVNETSPYTFNPTTAPVWVDDGTPDTDYYYTITTITDANGCTNTTDQGNEKVTVFKVPETGPEYTIPNDHAN